MFNAQMFLLGTRKKVNTRKKKKEEGPWGISDFMNL